VFTTFAQIGQTNIRAIAAQLESASGTFLLKTSILGVPNSSTASSLNVTVVIGCHLCSLAGISQTGMFLGFVDPKGDEWTTARHRH
jgi:hypothetical protein